MLGALLAVFAVVVAATAATGWRSDPDPTAADHDAAQRSGGSAAQPVAAPGSDPADPAASAGSLSLFDIVPAPPDAARDAALADVAGTLVAQGEDVRVESLTLSGAPTVYRVTITAGPYVMRDMPAVVALDGAPLGVAAESVDLASLVLFTHDDAVVTQGATVALSYGLPGQAPTEWSTTLEVVQ